MSAPRQSAVAFRAACRSRFGAVVPPRPRFAGPPGLQPAMGCAPRRRPTPRQALPRAVAPAFRGPARSAPRDPRAGACPGPARRRAAGWRRPRLTWKRRASSGPSRTTPSALDFFAERSRLRHCARPTTSDRIDARGAWDLSKGRSEVVVAILDTGVLHGPRRPARRHLDEPRRDSRATGLTTRATASWTTSTAGTSPATTTSAATITGTARTSPASSPARIDNGIGIAGVAGRATIMPVDVFRRRDRHLRGPDPGHRVCDGQRRAGHQYEPGRQQLQPGRGSGSGLRLRARASCSWPRRATAG